MWHDLRGHFSINNLYNIADFLQIFVQLAYTILVTVHKDIDLPFLDNNPADFETYNITKLYENDSIGYNRDIQIRVGMSLLLLTLILIVFV